MVLVSQQLIYIFYFGLFGFFIYLLAPILTPFLLGALLAYLFHPLVHFLEKKKINHLLSVILVFILGILIFTVIFLAFIPLVELQLNAFFEVLPKILAWVQYKALPWITQFIDYGTIKTSVSKNAPKADWVFSTVVQSSYTLIAIIVDLHLTPVVAFYFLRDWDLILNKIKNIIPKKIRSFCIRFAKECDEVLAGFFRGQLLVIVLMGLIYGIGLSIIKIQAGFFIGLLGGLLSLVPYLGSGFVLIIGSMTALVQYGDWASLISVLIVFLVGQVLEGYVLVPNLVGNRLGLHPIAVIFSIMAGGTLLGFFGIMLALPITAVIMAFLRLLKKEHISLPSV